MKQNQYFLFLLFTFVVSNSYGQLTVQGYTNYSLSGFNVLVEDNAYNTDSTLTNTAINLLETNLIEISQLNISQDKIDSLKAVPIFMDWNTTTGAAQYHPSQSWLIANGYIPQKARCVEISNITNFVNWTNQNQPFMVLHELAHAYHHRVLNYNDATITNAYNNAIAQNLYTNVSYHNGNGNYSTAAAAYGLNNEKEFFSELTEAYFGLNDYFPFDYNDLLTYDTVGFNTMVTIWGDITVSTQSISDNLNDILLYPNPVKEFLILNLGNNYNKTVSVQIFDLNGREMITPITNFTTPLLPIHIKGDNGVYLIKITREENSKVIRFLKN